MSFEWDFIKASHRKRGKDATEKNFNETDLSSFVRETIQNCNDAYKKYMDDGSNDQREILEVIFQSYKMSRKEKSTFFDILNENDDLLNHMKNSDTLLSHEHLKKSDITNYIKKNKILDLFVIHDFNTTGLEGDEISDKGAFASLCRNVGFSNKGNIANTGGSFGFGKIVLWMFSKFNTVLFLSYVPNSKGELKYRFFGVSVLGYHSIDKNDNVGYDGIGEFGRYEEFEGYDDKLISSIWVDDIQDLNFIPQKILDYRKGRRGTSIIMVGTHEFGDEDNIKVEENIDTLNSEIYKWFWPLITLKKINIKISYGNDEKILDMRNAPLIYKPYMWMFSDIINDEDYFETNNHILHQESQIMVLRKYKRNSSRKPEKKLARSDSFFQFKDDFKDLIDAIEEDPYYNNYNYDNHIAWMRGSMQIVKYERVNPPMGSKAYFGILLAGEAIHHWGKNFKAEGIKLVEEFLKYSEPPAHDDWNTTNSQIKEYYGSNVGAVGLLKDMLKVFRNNRILMNKRIALHNNVFNQNFLSLFPGKIGGQDLSRKKPRKKKSIGYASDKSLKIIEFKQEKKDNLVIINCHLIYQGNKEKWNLKIVPYLTDELNRKIAEDTNMFNLRVESEEILEFKDNVLKDIPRKNLASLKIEISNIPQVYKNCNLSIDLDEVSI